MSNERVEESYMEEWEKQFGVKLTPDKEEEDVSQDTSEEEGQIEGGEEQEGQESAEQEAESGSEEESSQEESEPQGRKPVHAPQKEESVSKDDEYRQFIESQPTEELKEKARKYIQGLKSADGRTSSLHRQLNAREQLIQQLYQRQPSQEKPSASTSSRQDGSAQKPSGELPEKVQALKQKNPEAAEIIEQIAKYHSDLSFKQMQELIDQRVGGIEQEREVASKQAEWQRVEEKAKDLFGQYGLTAADVARSEDFQAWLELKRAEEPGVYKLYSTAADADTAFIVLEKYEQEYQRALKEQGLDDASTAETHNKGDEIRNRRQKTKESNTGVKPSRAGTPTDDTSNLSYEEEWNRLWGPNGKLTQQRRR